MYHLVANNRRPGIFGVRQPRMGDIYFGELIAHDNRNHHEEQHQRHNAKPKAHHCKARNAEPYIVRNRIQRPLWRFERASNFMEAPEEASKEEAPTRVLFLSTDREAPECNALYLFLTRQPQTQVTYWSENLRGREAEIEGNYDFCVSYGYRHILRQPILDLFPDRIVNLHISYLPLNRGADPNLWSLLSQTTSGVTVHHMDAGVDTGDIIAQREVPFDMESETLASSYNFLRREIEDLFMDLWPKLVTGSAPRTVNPARLDASAGSVHRMKDKTDFFDSITPDGWNTQLSQVLKLYYEKVDPSASEQLDMERRTRTLLQHHCTSPAPDEPFREVKLIQNDKNVVDQIQGIAAGRGHSIIATPSGAFAFGDNFRGKLGTTHSARILEPTLMEGHLKGEEILGVAAGRDYSLIWTAQGDVYSCGDGGVDGTLGRTVEGVSLERIDGDFKAAGATAGTHHALVWTPEGHLYSFGNNEHGQLGHDGKGQDPKRIEGELLAKKIVGAVAGQYHTLVWTSDGEAYSFGYGSSGQLGHGTREDELMPRLIEGLLKGKKVIGAAAGHGHSMLMTADGEVYSFGNGNNRQLGHGSPMTDELVPRLIEGPLVDKAVVGVTAGAYHSLLWTTDGEAFSFGSEGDGRLGHESEGNEPSLVTGPLVGEKVAGAAAGYAHTLVWTTKGDSAKFNPNSKV